MRGNGANFQNLLALYGRRARPERGATAPVEFEIWAATREPDGRREFETRGRREEGNVSEGEEKDKGGEELNHEACHCRPTTLNNKNKTARHLGSRAAPRSQHAKRAGLSSN